MRRGPSFDRRCDQTRDTGQHEHSEWRWLWTQVRPFAGYQVAGVCIGVCANLLSLMNPLLMKWMIDVILPRRQWTALMVVAALFCLGSMARTLCGSATALVTARAVARCTRRLRRRLLRLLLALPPSFYRDRPIGDLGQRIESDVAAVSGFGSDLLQRIVDVVVQSAVVIGIMIVLDWRLTAIVLPLLPLLAWLRHRHRPSLLARSEAVRQASGAQSSLLVELLSGAIQIQLLGAERRMTRRYATLDVRSEHARWRQQIDEIKFSLMRMSVIAIGTTTILGYGGVRVLTGSLTAGGLIAFYSYVGGMFGPLTAITELHARLDRVRASIRRLREIENASREADDSPDAIAVRAYPANIAVRNVRFHYAPGRPALNDVSFRARQGERVALMGPSGCGKSSLLKLIPRLYDADGGSISIDDIDVRALRRRSLRRTISFVPQDPAVFRGTVRDNLHHGSPMATHEDMTRAVELACFDTVVSRLPKGLDTELGPMGEGLSGGERQRLAIARAVLQDRPVIVLDEATSALDSATEQTLFQRLDAWCGHRVVIVVGHRPSISSWADRVVQFTQAGCIAEEEGGDDAGDHVDDPSGNRGGDCCR